MYHLINTDMGYSGLNPVQFGYYDSNKYFFWGPASQDQWVLHFVVSGYGYYNINDKTYKVGSGDMFVIPPDVVTSHKTDINNPMNYIWIGFTTNSPLPKLLPDVIKCPEVRDVFIKMKDCKKFNEGKSAFLSARLWDVFSILLDENNDEDDYIKKALNYIHSEYMTDITVAKLAKRLNIERTYFSVLFKKKTNFSPKQYLTNYRMSIASSLLTEKNLSVSTTAYAVGYSDIFTFSKMFKRHFGISPKEYVKNNKKTV